jgi:hypothetical protein
MITEESEIGAVEENDLEVGIPNDTLVEILKKSTAVTVMVHGKCITADLEAIATSGFPLDDSTTIRTVVDFLEKTLSPEEVESIRINQQNSLMNGAMFVLRDIEPVFDYGVTHIKAKDLKATLEFNLLEAESDVMGLKLMTGVKVPYREYTNGLKRILKNQAVADLLNLAQRKEPEGELEFYERILSRMPNGGNTRTYALMLLRAVMQYALNVDNLAFRTAITLEVLKDENQ